MLPPRCVDESLGLFAWPWTLASGRGHRNGNTTFGGGALRCGVRCVIFAPTREPPDKLMMHRTCRVLAFALALCVGAFAAVSAAQARDLSDMSGAEIKALQQRLTDGSCYSGAIDGQASPALQAAIKACPSQDPVLRI